MDHAKEFMKLFESLKGRHDGHRIFRDWVTAASCTMLSIASPWHREQSEKDYLEAIKPYSKEEVTTFSRLLAITIEALEDKMQDFLGHCYMALELGNKHQGQFFTPYALSLVTAQQLLHGADVEKELTTFQEPASGSGGMIIAAMEAFRDLGGNYQTQTYTLAVDVSEMAARMTYLQFSILGIPAHVILGNTLSMEIRQQWPTLFYPRVAMKLHRLRQQERAEKSNDPVPAESPVESTETADSPPLPVQETIIMPSQQLELF